jgi:hypothetical protein
MGGPAGVADAVGAFERVFAQDLFEMHELAGSAADLENWAGGAADGDAGRVIAAVFEPAKALDDDRNDFFRTDVSDDAAHGTILCDRAPAAAPAVAPAVRQTLAGGSHRLSLCVPISHIGMNDVLWWEFPDQVE